VHAWALGWLHETSYSKRICHNFWLGQCPLLRTEYLGIHFHDIFASIQIKFDIDKNNNQQLKNHMGTYIRRKKKLIVTGSAQQHGAQVEGPRSKRLTPPCYANKCRAMTNAETTIRIKGPT
jgi:hypothetical protein